eukprot:TRINITY_DN6972_c0_g1_i1.p1 TRINITY_DN6972_c0_g1~~TRINITY_DN6972_c0_g1_i1.p1  ORF type:complete len:235 (+),score=39.33 TRINITY_DN6972_c0_g1_i1:26-730(+)
MQKLITSLILIASVAAVLGDWQVYITYANLNCTSPVAIELTSGQTCNWAKRSEQDSQQVMDCSPLSNENYAAFSGCTVDRPNMTEFSALPIVVTTYPSSTNCSEKDYTRYFYFAENYNGPMVASFPGRTEVSVNSTCSDAGVFSATLCTGMGCYTLDLPEDQCTGDELYATQSGCSAIPPPVAEVPSAVNTPNTSGTPLAQPTTTGPVAKPPSTSTASAISAVISVICLFNMLF